MAGTEAEPGTWIGETPNLTGYILGSGGYQWDYMPPFPDFTGYLTLNYTIQGKDNEEDPLEDIVLTAKITIDHGNQPVLTGTQATLPDGFEDTLYIINAIHLLEGFTHPDGDILKNLSVDSGAIVDNGDGIYIFTPDTNFYGTVNLAYEVTNSFEIAAVSPTS